MENPSVPNKKRSKSASSNTSSRNNNNSNNKKKSKHDLIASIAPIDTDVLNKYTRGSVKFNTNKIKSKGLRLTMKETQETILENAQKTAATEVLLTGEVGTIQLEGPNERTYKLRQQVIKDNVDLNTAKNVIDLQLTKFGPYKVDYTRNGRNQLFYGRKGHIAMLDCLHNTVQLEMNVEQEIYDAHFLHNETLFAVAQHKYAYIYDNKGVEIHCLTRHERPFKLDYLPYHYLLTSVGHSGWIKWQDISIGEYVAGFQTGHGPCKVLKHNPWNAVSHCGHSNGVVTLWSPASGKALISMLCHKSPITDLAIDREGKYMATTGMDGLLKIWDLRKFGHLHNFKLDHPATSVDISDKGMIGLGIGRTVQVLKSALISPGDVTYLKHSIRTPNPALSSGGGATARAQSLLSNVNVTCVKFRPLEDVLCAGHSHGLSTIITPGAGEPNYDTYEADPFMTIKQRREAEVHSMIHKLSYDMISLDASFIGSIDKDQTTVKKEHLELFNHANKIEPKVDSKDRKRGRNKISAKLRRKQKNVVDAQTLKLKEKLQKEKELNDKVVADKKIAAVPISLQRFVK